MPVAPQDIDGFPVLGELGRGGFSVVYEVFDERLDRHLALKLLAADVDGEGQSRFQTEARAAARVVHPNVVQVFGAGEWDGRLYILQELVRGLSLADVMETRESMAPELVVEIASQVADAMAAAESEGVVHRDIKPHNLLLTEQGDVKVADFGVAKLLYAPSSLTAEGTTLGTPHYMSPEQSRGAPVDARTDQYGLGATLYHLITGRPPFDDETTYGLLMKNVQEPLPPLLGLCPQCPPDLAATIERLLAKDPADRFINFDAVVSAFDALEGDPEGLLALAPSPLKPRSASQSPWTGPAALAAGCVAVGLFAFVLLGGAPSVRSKAKAVPLAVMPVPPATPVAAAVTPNLRSTTATPDPFEPVAPAPSKPARSAVDIKKRSTRRLVRDLRGSRQRAIEAAEELGRRADHDATDALLKTLQTARNEAVRRAVADAIGQLGDIRAIAKLDAILASDPTEKVKKAALQARNGLMRLEP